jgi:hypothetical protein
MAQKPWRARRQRTFTVSSTAIKLPGAPTNAQVSIDPTGANNTLIWRSMATGVLGNRLSVQYKDPQKINAALEITMNGSEIIVSLATNGSGTITTTAQQIIDKADTLVFLQDVVRVIASGTVSGTVAAVNKTFFAGGTDSTGDFALSITHAKLIVETNGVRIKADGNDPTASDGQLWPALEHQDFLDSSTTYRDYLENLRLIRSGASDATVSIEYFQN